MRKAALEKEDTRDHVLRVSGMFQAVEAHPSRVLGLRSLASASRQPAAASPSAAARRISSQMSASTGRHVRQLVVESGSASARALADLAHEPKGRLDVAGNAPLCNPSSKAGDGSLRSADLAPEPPQQPAKKLQTISPLSARAECPEPTSLRVHSLPQVSALPSLSRLGSAARCNRL